MVAFTTNVNYLLENLLTNFTVHDKIGQLSTKLIWGVTPYTISPGITKGTVMRLKDLLNTQELQSGITTGSIDSKPRLKNGVYSSKVSGYKSEFKIDGISYEMYGKIGVRGINIPDTVTVIDNGATVISGVIGTLTFEVTPLG